MIFQNIFQNITNLKVLLDVRQSPKIQDHGELTQNTGDGEMEM